MKTKYVVSRSIHYEVEAHDEMDAEDRFAQILRDPDTGDDEYKVEVREVKTWEDDEDLPEWWIDLESPQVEAPTQGDAYALAKAKIATGEIDIVICGTVEA